MVSLIGMTSSSDRRKGFWDEKEEDQTSTSAEFSQQKVLKSESEELTKKMHTVSMILDQTNALYLQYFNGVEKRPPTEKALLLERMFQELQILNPKMTTNRFKLTQFEQHYRSIKDLWARKLKAKEKT